MKLIPSLESLTSILSRSALLLGASLLMIEATQAQVIFKDNFDRPGMIPPAASINIAETTPEIGEKYTGEAVIHSAAAGGSAQAASEALGKANVVEALPRAQWNSARWWIVAKEQKSTNLATVTFTFDFFMTGTKGTVIFTSLADSQSNGRGFTIYLTSDGNISWWDGVGKDGTGITEAGTFELEKAVAVKVVADYENQKFTATIGDTTFEGTFNPETTNFRNAIIYNSSAAEFYYNNVEIAIGG